jgi:hypothetical protein
MLRLKSTEKQPQVLNLAILFLPRAHISRTLSQHCRRRVTAFSSSIQLLLYFASLSSAPFIHYGLRGYVPAGDISRWCAGAHATVLPSTIQRV